MEKYICLRDDDTCFFTNPGELIDGYGKYWGKIPITLGVVPFSHGSQNKMYELEVEENKYKAIRNWELKATAAQLTQYHKLHPVGDNEDLLRELQKQVNDGMIEIAQHGVSHRYNEYGAETTRFQMALPTIRDGKEYLSKLFGREIVTYIPPSNTIDSICANYIHSLGMTILSGGGIRYENSIQRLFSNLKDPNYFKSRFRRETDIPIRRPDGVYIMNSITYNNFNDPNLIFRKAKTMLEKTGFVSITSHYMLLNSNGWHGEHANYRENYQNLIEELSRLADVRFVTAQQYFSLLQAKYY